MIFELNRFDEQRVRNDHTLQNNIKQNSSQQGTEVLTTHGIK